MNELEQQLEQVAGDLAIELATVHGVLFKLLHSLCHTGLTDLQASLIKAALKELQVSQEQFFAKYGAEIGGAVPERN